MKNIFIITAIASLCLVYATSGAKQISPELETRMRSEIRRLEIKRTRALEECNTHKYRTEKSKQKCRFEKMAKIEAEATYLMKHPDKYFAMKEEKKK